MRTGLCLARVFRSTGTIETPTFSLDLANSSFEAAGPTSPMVTCNWAVSFKPAAAGSGISDNAARVYNIEVGAFDRTGNLSQLDTVGNWAVRQSHQPAN